MKAILELTNTNLFEKNGNLSRKTTPGGGSVKKRILILISITLGSVFMIFITPDLSRQSLEDQYAQAPSQFINIKGLRVHFRDTGERTAPVVVLLHGFGSSLQTWDEWSSVLDKNYRVVRLDLPGFGLTGATPEHDYSDRADVERLADFLNAIGVSRSTVVGHSMGGRIAWNFASTYPSHVDRLVLIAPDGFPAPGQTLGERPYDVGWLGDLIQFFMPKFLVKKSLEPAFFDASNVKDELLDRYYDLLRAPLVRQSILQRMRQTVNSDPVDRLKNITSPVLLLWGEVDRMIPCVNSQDYSRALAHSRTVILPEAGHLLQEENPQIALKVMLDFLAQKSL